MAYEFNGVKCDTLDELLALKRHGSVMSDVSQTQNKKQETRLQCPEYVVEQGCGLGLSRARCSYYAGHSEDCEA